MVLPPLQQEGHILTGQNTRRIGHYLVAIRATTCGSEHVILHLPKVSQAFKSAGSKQGPNHRLISKYEVEPLAHAGTKMSIRHQGWRHTM